MRHESIYAKIRLDYGYFVGLPLSSITCESVVVGHHSKGEKDVATEKNVSHDLNSESFNVNSI